MLITAMQLKKLEDTGTKLCGIITLTIDNMMALHDIKILKNGDTMFFAMPSRVTKANTFKDIVHPINSDVRQVLERLIFAAYEKAEAEGYGFLELVLREEDERIDFYQLSIENYEIGRSMIIN